MLDYLQVYEDLGHSHVVNTAWAMLALMLAGYHSIDSKPLARHAQLLPLCTTPQPSPESVLLFVLAYNADPETLLHFL